MALSSICFMAGQLISDCAHSNIEIGQGQCQESCARSLDRVKTELRIWPSSKVSGRLVHASIKVPERHPGIARLRHPVRGRDRFNLPARLDRRDGQGVFGSLQADLNVRIIVEHHERATLIALPALQFIRDGGHLVKKSIEFSNLTTKKRSVLCHSDLCETLDKIFCSNVA